MLYLTNTNRRPNGYSVCTSNAGQSYNSVAEINLKFMSKFRDAIIFATEALLMTLL